MALWPLYVAAVGAPILFGSAIAYARRRRLVVPAIDPSDDRRLAFRRAVVASGIGDDWLRFFEQTAYRESRFKPHLVNRTASEAAAAATSVKRNRKNLKRLSSDPDAWAFGSAGLFQLLGPVAILKGGRFRFPIAFINERGPLMAKDPGVAVAAAHSFAKGLTGWKNYANSFASLNIGWGNPSKMGNKTAIKNSAKKLEDRAAKLGWARGWAMDKPSRLPLLNQQEMVTLAKAAAFAYG